MPKVIEITPSAQLRPFVRAYHYTELDLGALSLVKPVTARPELMLQISLGRSYTPIDHVTGDAKTAPDVVLVGRQTRRNFDLLATGNVTTLTVHFQPAGFYRLFHLPMSQVTDQAVDAVEVLGPCTRELHGRVAEAPDLGTMVGHLESFLQARIDERRPFHPVQTMAIRMLVHWAVDVAALAAGCDLRVRQFERAFVQQVGVGPKVFSRIIRFTRTIQSKTDNPRLTWAEVAAGAGYFDQTHFIRDCQSFGGDSPTALMDTWIDCRP
ncbi:MAG: helix-turn-helix domain-containing protein [Acidimicrobiales bacterium]